MPLRVEIPLNRGYVAMVDIGDFDLVRFHTWSVLEGRKTHYAVSATFGDYVLMHRLIMDATDSEQVDHVDLNGLNNSRDNLRFATGTQQRANQPKQRGNYSSPYKGVTWFARDSRWKAQIMKSGINYHLGYFDNELDAALAYDAAAKERFGEYARTNF